MNHAFISCHETLDPVADARVREENVASCYAILLGASPGASFGSKVTEDPREQTGVDFWD